MISIPIPQELLSLKKPPKTLFAEGNLSLLQLSKKIAIVGTRKPNPYTKALTFKLAELISKNNGVVVSGGALGVDIIAHQGAGKNTIMISPSSLDFPYPKTNASIIKQIYSSALALSEYENNPSPKPYHFLERNRLVIALSDLVIIPQADLNSGSMESAKIALSLNKPLFTFPHRLGESEGTNSLLSSNKAQAIYNLQDWIKEQFGTDSSPEDEILEFCQNTASFQEVYEKFGERVYEYEMEGKIKIENGRIYVC